MTDCVDTPDENEKKRRRPVAYHEAGHAVVASVLDIEVKYIELGEPKCVPPYYPEAFTSLAPSRHDPHDWEAAQKRILVLRAGHCALAKVMPQHAMASDFASFFSREKNDDETKVREILARFFEPRTPEVYAKGACLDRQTRQLVEDYWPEIEAVAQALINCGLSNPRREGAAIRQIVQEVEGQREE